MKLRDGQCACPETPVRRMTIPVPKASNESTSDVLPEAERRGLQHSTEDLQYQSRDNGALAAKHVAQEDEHGRADQTA